MNKKGDKMDAIVVDDEQLALEEFLELLTTIDQIKNAKGFLTGVDCLRYVQTHMVSIAFLDIELKGMTGLALARQIKEIQPSCKLVFVSAYAQYAVDAFKVRPMNYLLKPVGVEDIKEELSYLESLQKVQCKHEGVYVQCFGNFEVFIHGVPAKFRYSKTRELFAVLVDRKGKAGTMEEFARILWEDKPYTGAIASQLRNLFVDLQGILKQNDLSHILIKKRNYAMLDVVTIDCDYYHFLNKESIGVNAYMGEYMAQYSWAEMTNGALWVNES